ncbi:Fc.00g106200.m01.CDS01 [Cosmosporella sp. VM-42]
MVHPAQGRSASQKRQAHSHAARVAHARARKLRMANHMPQKGIIAQNGNPRVVVDASEHQAQVIVARQPHKQASASSNTIRCSISKTIPGAFEHEPLARFLGSLTSREHFIFHHYVRVVFPNMQVQCPVIQYLGELQAYVKANWILLSSTDMDLLKGFLLAACRHLSMVGVEKEYDEFAIQYKLRYVRNLRETISAGNLVSSRMAVTRALVLAFDEIMLRDMSMASKHVLGAVRIIEAAGGVQALSLSDIVRYLLYSCIYGKGLPDWEPALLYYSSMLKEPESMSV